ncbi:MAG: VOC family protein [Alphaproteobacteria bacterium]|nr:VOC family protein [Alphaproteobacteria bacterium]
MNARIRYLALLSDRPDDLASFYARHLDLEELGRSNDGDVSLSDGFYNLTLFNWRPELMEPKMERGLHHVGLQVDSVADVIRRYRRFDPHGLAVPEPGGLHYGTTRIFDPECNPISLSEGPFGVEKEVRRYPRIVHIALNAINPQRILDFYTEVLGFREVGANHLYRQRGRLNCFAGDGVTNLAIHPFYCDAEGHESRFGINHFGFLVADQAKRIKTMGEFLPTAERPADRPFAEYRLHDPEGNKFDLAQGKGWEVDFDTWDAVKT